MRILEPKVEFIPDGNKYEKVAKCASICYASADKTGDKAEKFYNSLVSSNHVSMLRHESHYYIFDLKDDTNTHLFMKITMGNPYVEVQEVIHSDGSVTEYAATNGNFNLDHKYLMDKMSIYEVTPEEFDKTEIGHQMMRYTFLITTSIAVSREGNRKSPNCISEMSTRYIKFGGKVEPAIVKPHWMDNDITMYIEKTNTSDAVWEYVRSCSESFDRYNTLLKLGMKPEDARGVLPLDTMTKVIYTYSVKEWKHFLDLRLFDKTGKAHPDIKIIAQMIYDNLSELGYDFTEE